MKYSEIKNILMQITDPVEKLEYVMELGKQLKKVPNDAICVEISGCASFVQICRHGNEFYGVADSAMVRGIVAIIISMVDGKTPDSIKQIDMRREFSELDINLGASRINGVNSIFGFLENL